MNFSKNSPASIGLLLTLVMATQPARGQTPVSVAPNSWATGAPMPTAREGVFTGVIGNKIYVIGGAAGSNVFGVNEIYDPATNSWSTGAPMPTPRWIGASAVVNGVLYAIGGGNASGSVVYNVVEAYDPVANAWSTKSPMPIVDDSVYATVDNGIIYVIGGYANGQGRLTSVVAYNPATDSWSTAAPLKVGKSNSAIGVLGSTIVSAGGLTDSGVTTDNESYAIGSNSWTTLAAMPTARVAGCFEALGDTLYVAGGNQVGNTTQLNTMDAYDAATNSWATGLPTMPHAVVGAGSATVNGRLYCFGGSNEGDPEVGTVFNYVQIYQPPPAIDLGGVVPVFSSATTIEPGSWVSIYGTNLAAGTTVWNGDFPTMLGGTSVTINNKPAYIWYVSPTQINVQAPDDTTLGPVPVIVNVSGSTASATVTLGAYGPSFSLLSNKYPAAVVATAAPGNSGAGYDYIGPVGAFSFPTRPVKAGETVLLYGVGFGPTTTPVPAGKLFSGAAQSVTTPQITIGGVNALVQFAGIVEAGLFQFNVVVPSLPSGDQPLVAMINGVTTPGNVYLTLQ